MNENKVRPERALAAACAVLLCGCAAAFGQTDGFGEKIKGGCKTEQQCIGLEAEAEARVAKCKPNTIGYVKCSDAEAELILVRGYTKPFGAKRTAQEEGGQTEAEIEVEERRAALFRRIKEERIEREKERRRLEAEWAEASQQRKTEALHNSFVFAMKYCGAKEASEEDCQRLKNLIVLHSDHADVSAATASAADGAKLMAQQKKAAGARQKAAPTAADCELGRCP